MKTSIYRYFWESVCLLLGLSLLLGGCATHTQQKVERIPKPQILADHGQPKLLPSGLITMRLRQISQNDDAILVNDRRYIYITDAWFAELLDWTNRFIRDQVPALKTAPDFPLGYVNTYAALMSSVANVAVNKRYNIKGSVCIGIAVVKNVNPWGLIKPDGQAESYVIALTATGGIFHDPKTGQTASLETFPNREHIIDVLL